MGCGQWAVRNGRTVEFLPLGRPPVNGDRADCCVRSRRRGDRDGVRFAEVAGRNVINEIIVLLDIKFKK